jgi:hypothetical protein
LGAGVAGAGIGAGALVGSGVDSIPVFSVSMWSPRGFNMITIAGFIELSKRST